MNSSSEAAHINSLPEKFNKDANQNVFSITVEKDGEKNTSHRAIVDTKDNWITKLLYGGPIGYVINFSSLIATTVYLVIHLRQMLNDEQSYRTIVEPYWLPTVINCFIIVFPMDILLCTFLVLIVYPLTRLSRSTVYYWCLGLTSSAIMFAAIWPVRQYMILILRTLVYGDWCRMSMKMASFLVECSKSEQVHKKSSITSFLYFIWIPTLVYKHEYPVARRIRWFKVLAHFWWLLAGGLAYSLLAFEYLDFFRVDLLTISFERLFMCSLVGAILALAFYPILIWFYVFENFCGLHGELLRYPNLKFFGSPLELIADPPTALNTVASKWFSRYIYIPVVKNGGSRIMAMWLTFSLSLPIHDLAYFYMGDIVVLIEFIFGISLIPFALTLQPKSRFHQLLWAVPLILFCLTWVASYPLEFIAWHYSSMPDVDQLSRIRLVPLFVTQLYQNFLGHSM